MIICTPERERERATCQSFMTSFPTCERGIKQLKKQTLEKYIYSVTARISENNSYKSNEIDARRWMHYALNKNSSIKSA